MSSFAKTLITISAIILNIQRDHDLLTDRQTIDDEYDYIIIGAGSAGSVVASRLSEIQTIKVLVVEAGDAESVVSDMPGMTKTLWGSDMDWNFEISPQKNSFLGYNNNLGRYSQGKVMGGSSTINALAYVRGLAQDFDLWKSYGIEGWSLADVMPYFIKSENNSDSNMNKTFHGNNGYLSVSTPRNPRLLHKTMLRAAEELGFSQIDLNDPKEPIGVAIQQMTVGNGMRYSASKAFLNPVKHRTNLHIWAKAVVTKINFDSNKKAVSVMISKSGKLTEVKAKHEIIVSAGAINSPKLLMLSGIGPRDHLTELKIPVIADTPVGDNFHDNPISFGVHFLTNQTKISNEILERDITEFFLNRTGILTQFEKSVLRVSTNLTYDKSYPDIQIFADTGSLADFPDSETAEKVLNIKKSVWNEFYKPYSNSQYSSITLIPLLNRPKSRGTVRLKSNQFKDQPNIDPNYFSDESDLKTIIEGMKIAHTLAQTKSFKEAFDPKVFNQSIPNCEHSFLSDGYFECIAKSLTNTYNHASGSVKMGSHNDSSAVLTPDLKVKGVLGLRVIDASVCPQSPSGSLYATTLMIGEKGSVMIINDYNHTNSITSCVSESIYKFAFNYILIFNIILITFN